MLSSPQYDAVAEFGGYIPGRLKDKLFFFGAFNPSLRQDLLRANPNAPPPSVALGTLTYSTTTLSWAGKLTYRHSSATTFEASAFGDPSRHNSNPLAVGATALSSYFPHTTASSWQFGSRNAIARITHSISPTWLVDAEYSYNYNHFDEHPATSDYQIVDASGNALYTYDADQAGRSSCYSDCAKEFPPYVAEASAKASGDFTILVRDDHMKQWVYQGQPLYRYSGKDP